MTSSDRRVQPLTSDAKERLEGVTKSRRKECKKGVLAAGGQLLKGKEGKVVKTWFGSVSQWMV